MSRLIYHILLEHVSWAGAQITQRFKALSLSLQTCGLSRFLYFSGQRSGWCSGRGAVLLQHDCTWECFGVAATLAWHKKLCLTFSFKYLQQQLFINDSGVLLWLTGWCPCWRAAFVRTEPAVHSAMCNTCFIFQPCLDGLPQPTLVSLFIKIILNSKLWFRSFGPSMEHLRGSPWICLHLTFWQFRWSH